jgi:integrase
LIWGLGFFPANEEMAKSKRFIPQRYYPAGTTCPYVFHDHATGKPFQDVKRSFKTALKHAGIRDFHFHDLRHTFASHLVMAAIDLTTV